MRKIINKIKLHRRNIINIFIITTIFVTISSVAKYQTTLESTEYLRVAAGIIRLKPQENLYLNTICPSTTNDSHEYLFEVTNVSENNVISEVTLKYYIGIDGTDTLPLVYNLYKYNEALDEYEEVEMNNDISNDIIINPKVATYDKYKLVISWDKSDDKYMQYEYMKTLDFVSVRVDCTQVD